jgi:hypothetical protein
MKTLITSVVLAITFSVLLTGPAQGQVFLKRSQTAKALKYAPPTANKLPSAGVKPTRPSPVLLDLPLSPEVTPLPKGNDKLTAVKNNRGEMVLPQYDVLAGLRITRFDASNNGARINIMGVVSNVALQPLPFSYKFSKWSGASWTNIEQGRTVTIQAKTSTTLTAQMPATKEALRLKLEINGGNNEYRVKEFKLAARPTQFVVRYSTNGWLLIRDDTDDGGDKDKLLGEATTSVEKTVKSYGIETQMHMTKTQILFSFSARFMLYARALKPLERSFDTEREANEFASSLRSLMRNLQPGTNGAPNTFLTVQISERSPSPRRARSH